MRVAITGGTGFVGGHLAEALARDGNDVVLVARGVDRRPRAREALNRKRVTSVTAGLYDEAALTRAFAGCEAVAHCAGINRELRDQTFQAVHVRGTENVVRAAERAGVRRMALISFLRARPNCGSAYHESKWAAEQIVRASNLEWTVLKPGMMFGRGDHMLDHLTRALNTFPIFMSMPARRVRPLAVADAVALLKASLVDGRLVCKTVAVVGPTELDFFEGVRLVAGVIGKRPIIVSLPISFTYALAWFAERLMTVPLISIAQVRILAEDAVEPVLAPDPVPDDLAPRTPFNAETVRAGAPLGERFRLRDLRWMSGRTQPTGSNERHQPKLSE